MEYTDILYDVKDRVATITINRPQVLNAFRARTCDELNHAFQTAGYDREIGAIVLTGAGDRAFCTGGDQGDHTDGGYAGGRGVVGLAVEEMHTAIRDAAKPVIAKVRGYAIGGGNVLATICDLTLAAQSATFGQVGPKMGSVDPGFGTAYLARVVGEKKAREMWYLCRRYSAAEALAMGLVNAVFPDDQLDAGVAEWCAELAERSPTAIALAKTSFNADSESIRGLTGMAFQAVALYYNTDESKEGVAALKAKRKPNFRNPT